MREKNEIINEDILTLYFKEIRKYPLLTHKEEVNLIKKIQNGNNQQAKEELINSHLKFVVKIAKPYQHRGLSFLDLINEGNLGLMYAIKLFDLRKKVHFITYAVFWIKAYLTKAIIDQSKNIRLPVNKNLILNKIKRHIRFIEESEKRTPNTIEIAKCLGLKIDIVKNLLQLDQPNVLLDSPLSTEKSNSDSLGDKILNSKILDPINYTINQCCKDDINKVLLSSLKDMEAQIIIYRFGLNGNKEHSLTEIGNIFKLTKERIRQIEKIALNKLRHPNQKRKLQDYYNV
ncbi:hypothetical protein LCGC14_2019280 [marine sediment metagenome]|uniref:RNA polymerase sigma-70 domain-containing protein n=1 Tax=marine sediment metagenome TaxID=412755 RepID=A0A0F9FKH8_9ZZZZ